MPHGVGRLTKIYPKHHPNGAKYHTCRIWETVSKTKSGNKHHLGNHLKPNQNTPKPTKLWYDLHVFLLVGCVGYSKGPGNELSHLEAAIGVNGGELQVETTKHNEWNINGNPTINPKSWFLMKYSCFFGCRTNCIWWDNAKPSVE